MTSYPEPTSSSGPSGPRAGFGRRLVALIIDSIVLGIGYAILAVVLGQGVGYALSLLLALAYYGYLEGSGSGQTIGKKALGIRVIDFRSGERIGFGRGLIRYIGKIISSIPCALGFLWALWDREKQTWHDKIATTVVVPEAAYPVRSWPG